MAFGTLKKLISKETDKSKDELFIGAINKSGIIGLAEVKCDLNKAQFDNFVAHYVERKSKKGNQSYGGLGILVKKTIREGVKYLPLKCSEYQWLELDKCILALIKIFMYVLHIFHRSARHFLWTRMLTF